MYLGNNRYNFQLHRLATGENIAKSFRGATFLTHSVQYSDCTVLGYCQSCSSLGL